MMFAVMFRVCCRVSRTRRGRHARKLLALVCVSTAVWLATLTVVFDAAVAQFTLPCRGLASHPLNCHRSRGTTPKETYYYSTQSTARFHLLKPDKRVQLPVTPVVKNKIILRWTRFYGAPWSIPKGNDIFTSLSCLERRCIITDDKSLLTTSDLVVIHVRDLQSKSDLPPQRQPDQRWLFLSLESPFHQFSNTSVIKNLGEFNGLFNWTSTYSSQSDFPVRYGEYTPFTMPPSHVPKINWARSKTRQVVWFVTNCNSKNNREAYARQLAKYIRVDIYGLCGRHKCEDGQKCDEMIRKKYKFYLSFENSNCDEYITEKLWVNALSNGAIPVVMGPPRSHYERVAPPASFIHVDDFAGPPHLARFLRALDNNERLYNSYFAWRSQGMVRWFVRKEPTRSPVWCDLCSALHHRGEMVQSAASETTLQKWWSVKTQCRHPTYDMSAI